MFGKKSSAGTPKSKPKKSVKQGLKVNFFAAHAEKLALGAVVAAAAFLIYDGLGGKTFDKSKQPKQLEDKATQLISNIKSNDPWPEIAKERIITHDYTPKTEAGRFPTNPDLYPARDWEPSRGNANTKRGDPQLLPPLKVLGQSVVGLIAVEAADNYVDPFEDIMDAPHLKTKGSGSSSQQNPRGRGKQAPGGDDTAQGSGMGMGMGSGKGMGGDGGMMGSGQSSKRYFPQQYNRGFSMGGGSSMGGMMGGGMMGGSGMMGGGMGGGSEGAGMEGGMMGSGAPGGMPGGATGGGLGGPPNPNKPKKYKAEVTLFNAVTALVPHDDMLKEFNEKLRESASYNAFRDRPIYLDFEVERAEVKPGDQPLEWKHCTSAREQLKMAKNWVKAPIADIIDPGSYDQALTMPIPPLLLQDYRKFAKHPDIDWIWDAGLDQLQLQMQMLQQAKDAAKQQDEAMDEMLPGDRPNSMGMGMGMPGAGMGSGMMGGGSDMAGGGMMGGKMGGGSDGGDMMGGGMMGGGMMGGKMGGGSEGGDMASGMMGGGMMGGGMMGGGMMGGGMMGMGQSAIPVKYKMVRFYDKLTGSDIGKTYKYRIKLYMEDPNYPADKYPAPSMTDMETKVFERVSDLRAKEDPKAEAVRLKNLKRVPVRGVLPPPEIFNRTKLWTSFSEPSNGVYVRGIDDVYVHKMGKQSASPEVEAVLVRLDVKKGAYVPAYVFNEDKDELKKMEEELDEKPVSTGQLNKTPPFKRGAIMVFDKLTTHVVHPITNVVKRITGYSVGLNETYLNTVVDIRGGNTLLGNSKDDPLSDNVEMMMLMSDGRIEVSNEFDDDFTYRGITFADEREAAEKGTSGSASGYGGAGGMMGGK